MSLSPEEVLKEGSALLAPILVPVGFSLGPPDAGNGSGGHFAFARWTRGAQYLETHVRGALGIVTYGCGDRSFSHQDYMRWREIRGAYPGYSDDPVDGFRHLVADLSGPAAPILALDDEKFLETANAVEAMPRRYLP
jgi:hypothetical protein